MEDEEYVEIIKQDVAIDANEFNKYIAYFDIILFGLEDKLIKLENASCIFLSKDDDTAKYRSTYEMFQTCLLEGMPIKSINFMSVCLCVDMDVDINGVIPADKLNDGDIL